MRRKKVLLMISLLFLLGGVLMINFWKKYKIYEKYRYPNEDFFGKELYAEITYNCSDQEREVGNAILNKAIKVAEYAGTKNVDETSDVGALSQYYYYNRKLPVEYETVFQEMEFQLITCKVTQDRGHVWVVYTSNLVNSQELF